MAEISCGGEVGRKEGIRSRGSSSCLQGNEVTRCESVFDGLDCCNLEWGSCVEARLGTAVLSQSPNEQRLASGGAGIFGHLQLVLRDPMKSWITRNMAWSLDGFVLAAICYADDVVLVAAPVAAAEVIVAGVTEKLKEVGLSVGAQKTHWTSHPKMVDRCIVVDGLAVLWEKVLEFLGSKVCLDGKQGARLHTEHKPTSVWRNGDPF